MIHRAAQISTSIAALFGGLFMLAGLCPAADGGPASSSADVRFRKTQLDDKFRSEGAAVGDFNHDGRMDIAAGFVWYESPDWKMHVIAEQPPAPNRAQLGSPPYFDPKNYSNSFCNFVEDLNGDGWDDLIVVDFPGTPTWWFENPQNKPGDWRRHTLTEVTNNESPQLLDLDGDGNRELIAAFSPDPTQPDGPDRQMAFFRRRAAADEPWTIHPISEKGAPGAQKYSHGLGVGDVDGDGRNDILCADGWWRAPADLTGGLWSFHAAPFGGKAAHMPVYDFDGDGDADVLTSNPHDFGLWWHEQTSPNEWRTHTIDNSFSQPHAVCLADINGDGLPDIVTGKRWWAHGGRDPGADQPAVFFWYELTRRDGKAEWVRHQFDHESGHGTQFEVADVNADGLLDVVSSNKRGVFYFEQSRR